jgi:hypothetical protein
MKHIKQHAQFSQTLLCKWTLLSEEFLLKAIRIDNLYTFYLRPIFRYHDQLQIYVYSKLLHPKISGFCVNALKDHWYTFRAVEKYSCYFNHYGISIRNMASFLCIYRDIDTGWSRDQIPWSPKVFISPIDKYIITYIYICYR